MEAFELTKRDDYIVQEYRAGKEVSELARINGLTERRIKQILGDRVVTLRPRHAGRTAMFFTAGLRQAPFSDMSQ